MANGINSGLSLKAWEQESQCLRAQEDGHLKLRQRAFTLSLLLCSIQTLDRLDDIQWLWVERSFFTRSTEPKVRDKLKDTCRNTIFFNFFYAFFFNFTILYWFCHISTWIRHRHTRVPHPDPSSLLPPHTIPLGRPSAPAPSIQYRASNLDWQLISYMILYMFQCHSPKSSHPLPLPQSPKDFSIRYVLIF